HAAGGAADVTRRAAEGHATPARSAHLPRGPFRFAPPLSLALLLAPAYVGVSNQALRARELGLIADKTNLLASVARAEVRAAAVEGPLAVAEWAETAGMVPLPQGHGVAVAAPEPAPVFEVPEPALELRTVWR